MARPKKNNLPEDVNNPIIETTDNVVSELVHITSLVENLKFGIYWIDSGIKRIFRKDEFEKNKALCPEFDEEFKKGNIKIEH